MSHPDDRSGEMPSAPSASEAMQGKLEAKQAEIDRLMLEYCPEEMTPEQVENWKCHQKPISAEEEAAVNLAPRSSTQATGETPRTDAVMRGWAADDNRADLLENLARQLERELAIWQRDNAALHRACEGYRKIIDAAPPSAIERITAVSNERLEELADKLQKMAAPYVRWQQAAALLEAAGIVRAVARSAPTETRPTPHTETDGYATWTCMKGKPTGQCCLQVVRPGKVQCECFYVERAHRAEGGSTK